MPRAPRVTPAGVIFHVVNRVIEGYVLFADESDYLEFYRLLVEVGRRYAVRVCAFCLMPTHWHLVLWPSKDGEVTAYIHWLTTTHSLRFRRKTGTIGRGHVYQDRFHAFAVQTGRYYYNVVRYVEANALSSGLVARAEDWAWSSLSERQSELRVVSEGPLPLPTNWVQLVNTHLAQSELVAVESSEATGRPYGSALWTHRNARALHLEQTLHSRGRHVMVFGRNENDVKNKGPDPVTEPS